jgi:hypothetical protein
MRRMAFALVALLLACLPAHTQSADPCVNAPKQNVGFGTASATNVQVVAPQAGHRVYICSLSLLTASAAVFNVIEGTGAACITANQAAIIGSTTAANGMALVANGGLTYGNGDGTVGSTSFVGNGVCILTSGAVQFGGNMTYVQQ